MGKRKQSVSAVSAIQFQAGNDSGTISLRSSEHIDPMTGKVTETHSIVSSPALAIKDEIHDKRYQRIRSYLLSRKHDLWRAEQRRNEVRPSNFKERRRRPATVVSSTVCPTCDGSGYAKKGDCPHCKGEGWVLTSR